jgi:biopolymer transport protein ExbB/TolQ
MQLIAVLKTFIYLISSSLFLPVLLILSCLFVWMLVYSGTFFRRWLERSRLKKQADNLPEKILSGRYRDSLPMRVVRVVTAIEPLKGTTNPVPVINLLREAELTLLKSLDGLKMMIRIGPGLGLIGTLIPMGTGLASLGQGDLSQLSQDLVVAFTTTVVGMALGLVAYFYFTIQHRWVEQDIKNIELAAELLAGDAIHHAILEN